MNTATRYRSNATAICVLGMHRGGTSAVTGVVHELGAFLGPAAHLMARREDNPVGFFEHQLLTDLNDELLHALGGSWHHPPTLEPGWELALRLDGIRARARHVLHEDFGDASLWAWKDPRTALTLPFWRPLLPTTRFVVCVRNPLDVARSLRVRDGLDETIGVDLWMRHTVGALAGHTSMPLLVLYDELVDEPASEVDRIAAFLALDVAPGAAARARAHLADNAGLRHHHATLSDVCAAPAVTFAALALYAVVQRAALLQRAGALRPDDLSEVGELFGGRAAQAHSGERDAEGWSSRVAAVDAHAAALTGALAGRDEELRRARDDGASLAGRLDDALAEAARAHGLRREQEAEAAVRISASEAEMATLRLAREFDLAALRATRATGLAAVRATHAADLAALRTTHDTGLADLRATHATAVALLRAAHEATLADARATHGANVAAVRAAHAANLADVLAAHETALTEVRATHAANLAGLRATHATDVAAQATAHDLAMSGLRAARDADLAALRVSHDTAVAGWRARAEADAATNVALHRDVQRTHAELDAATAELSRLAALLLHLQTPTGIAKLGLRALLPAGVHRWLRAWARGDSPVP